jgi:hypothetical protein
MKSEKLQRTLLENSPLWVLVSTLILFSWYPYNAFSFVSNYLFCCHKINLFKIINNSFNVLTAF